jgi:rubrerythrin
MIAFFTGTLVGRVLAAVLVILSAYAGFRIWLSAHDDKLLSGYVLQSEKTALQAQLDEMERQKNAAAQSLEEYRKRAVADALIQQKIEAQLEQAIQDDNQNMDDGDYRWSDADRLWLCKQRGATNCGR